jgi:hypothetical protein
MTRIRRYPLRGCRFLAFKYVSNRLDGDLDFWVVTCSKDGKCAHRDREGGTTKSCFTDPFLVSIGESEDGEG